jgi:hypothetical protein
LRLIRLFPFLTRWLDATPATCCGVCPTCIGVAATSVLLPMVVRDRAEKPDKS